MITLKKWSLLQIGKVCSKFGALAMGIVLFSACGDDDGDIDPGGSPGTANVRITAVDAANDQITLRNFGTADEDISGYFFCNQRVYVGFSSTANNGTDLTLSPNEEIVFTVTIADDASDVAIYDRGGSFTSPDAMVDFMQYGASFAGSGGREDVAVAKGIWTAGDFIEDGSPFTYVGDGSTTGVATWDGVAVTSNVRLTLVDPINDLVTLKNFGTGDQDISGYFFCRRKGYVGVGSLTPVSGDLMLSADEEAQFSITIDDTSSDFALYANNSGFGSAENILDFFQFGENIADAGRIDVAVAAGIWAAGAFVEGNSPFNYEGDGDENGATFWTATAAAGVANVRIVNIDPTNDLIVLKNFGDVTQDISGYFFCRRKQYANVGGITPTSGDYMLEPNEEIEFPLTMDDNASDVAIYKNNSGFGSADNIVDFLQYGDDVDTDGREDVAVTAGIWTEDEFVNGVGPFSYTGDGSVNGSTQWDATADGASNVRLIAVDPTNDKVTLKNFGTASQDISGYFFCLRKVYPSVAGSTATTGNLILAPNEEIEFTVSINDTSSDVGLYINNSGFANSDNLQEFMQFGEDVDTSGREDVAVAAGIWTVDEFVANPGPFSYTGDGAQNGASFWD